MLRNHYRKHPKTHWMILLLWCFYNFCVLFLTVIGHFWFCVSCIRRLMFPSKISPSLNIPDLHPKVTYCFSEGSTVSYHNVFTISDWQMDTGHSSHVCFAHYGSRSSMACHCLALSALLKSRKDFYVSRMGKRLPSKAVSSQPKTRRRQGKHMGQVDSKKKFFLNISLLTINNYDNITTNIIRTTDNNHTKYIRIYICK